MVEEIEEGGTLPANATATPAAVPIAGYTTNQDISHNYYHLGNNSRRRERAQHRDFVQTYAERDRELDQNMVDREVAARRDMRMLELLDRERDRGGTDVIDLLNQELDRRRDIKSSSTSKKARVDESDNGNEAELRAEIKTLRKDLRRLLKGTSRGQYGTGSKNARTNDTGTSSAVSQVSCAPRTSAARDIRLSHKDEDDGDSYD